MAGLTVALNTALTGLNVNQQSLATLSQNIANANTPGYSRQIINQQALYQDGQGEGVAIESITRKIDAYLVKAVQQQGSTAGQTGAINDYNTQIQTLLGQPGNNNSIDTYINTFFNDLQSLAQSPQNTTLQQTVVNDGAALASQMNQLAEGLQGLQFQADQDIGQAVDAVNNDLVSLAQINNTIVTGTVLGQSVAGLQDQRDSLLNDISQYINIQVFTKPNGAITVSTSNGAALLDNNAYQLTYTPASSQSAITNGSSLSPLLVYATDADGNKVGQPVQLVSGGTPSQVTSVLSSGKIAGLLTMRDQQVPDVLNQLDELANSITDQVNAIQNSGSGFPGANSYTGTRAVNAGDYSQWGGSVNIAVLGQDGQPIASPYADEPNGMPPLTLDLSKLDTGQGAGNPSVQGIINAINQYYGTPQNKAEVGNLNNIQLVSDSSAIPGTSQQLNFDFNLNNISSGSAGFYVTGMQVQAGATSLPVTSPVPSIALDPVNTYVTTGTPVVTINTVGANNGLVNGEKIFLSTPPAGTYSGIPAADLGGFFTVSGVTPTSFQITAAVSGDGTTSGVAGQTATPPFTTAPAGEDTRTNANGIFSANLAGNTGVPYYTVTADVAVEDAQGNVTQSEISYQIPNDQTGATNSFYSAQSMLLGGNLVTPTSTQPLATAMLVDANGNELPKVNGQYVTTQNGYLEIKADNSSNVIAIDSQSSSEQGKPNDNPPVPGTGRGFSYYFDLNDFFKSSPQTITGDTVAGSALGMQVEQSLLDDPGLVALGTLTQSPSSADPNALPNYTYQLNSGDNSVIQQLADLGIGTVNFAPAGGLGATTQSFSAYAGQIIGSAAANASQAATNNTNAQTLLDGYTKQSSAVSGVNLDTELANTVIYQNAYAASARVITVVSGLFDTLLNSFSGT